MGRRSRRTVIVVLVVTACSWAGALGARAHPGGLPGLLEITGRERTVTIDWSAPPDDVAVLAERVGETPRAIADHVLARVTVRQGDRTCPGEVTPGRTLEDGARLEYRCPREVGAITVRATILTDVDPAYQTLAVAPVITGPERVLFSGGTTEHRFVLSDAPPPPDRGAVPTNELETAYGFEERFLGLVESPPGPLGLVAVAAALLVGAAHALAPGHGKTIAAAYLVGGEGRHRDAVLLGVAVAGMHTASVLAIGLGVYATTRTVSVARLLPWLGVAAGVAVLGLGLWMTARRLRGRRAGAPRTHEHAAHHHLPPPEVAPLSGRGLAIVASSGGLLPSPTALAALLAAIAVGRVALGLALVTAFSIGLASAIATIGFAVLWGRDRLLTRADRDGWVARAARYVPTVGAVAVAGAGAVLTVRAVLAL